MADYTFQCVKCGEKRIVRGSKPPTRNNCKAGAYNEYHEWLEISNTEKIKANKSNTIVKKDSKSDTPRYRVREDEELKRKVQQAAGKAASKANKMLEHYKQELIEAMVDAEFIDDKTEDEIAEIDFKGTSARDHIDGILREMYSNSRQRFDEIINECAEEADRRINDILD